MDVEAVADALRAGAQQRNLRLLEAVFTVQPTVVLNHETTAVDEVLDLAQLALAPFIAIQVTWLDAAEFDDLREELDGEIPAGLDELMRAVGARDGQADGVYVRWLVNGVVFLYVAVPGWRIALDERREEWEELEEAERTGDEQTQRIRITHLADRLEQEPAYRGGTSHSRRSIGKDLLESWVRGDEGSMMIEAVLERAGRLVRDNAASAYAVLSSEIDQLSHEIWAREDWHVADRAASRSAAARTLLIERAGGYAPPKALVDELRRAAEGS